MTHTDHDIDRMEVLLESHETMLRGDRETGKGGLAALSQKTAEALFGQNGTPGVIADLKETRKLAESLAATRDLLLSWKAVLAALFGVVVMPALIAVLAAWLAHVWK